MDEIPRSDAPPLHELAVPHVPAPAPSSDEPVLRESYQAYSRNLRAWFIAFGVGVPALLLTQEPLRQHAVASGHATLMTILFLSGTAIQVVSAILYKYAMECVYLAEIDADRKNTRAYDAACYVSKAMWLEFLFDATTLGLFGVGTILAAFIVGTA